MHDRTEWSRGRTGDFELLTRTGKKKSYKNLTEFTRRCATCDKPFAIYVTSKIAAGQADSNSFGLKNCEEHRRSAIRTVSDESLLMANNTMKEELKGLYGRVNDLVAEIAVLKASLAKYELPAAMQVAAAEWTPEKQNSLPLTFPWENR